MQNRLTDTEKNLQLTKEEGWGRDELGAGDKQIQMTIHKIDKDISYSTGSYTQYLLIASVCVCVSCSVVSDSWRHHGL